MTDSIWTYLLIAGVAVTLAVGGWTIGQRGSDPMAVLASQDAKVTAQKTAYEQAISEQTKLYDEVRKRTSKPTP